MKLTPLQTNLNEIRLNNGTRILFSYATPVACYDSRLGFMRTAKFWSQTTSRHINKWLDGAPALQAEQVFFDTLAEEEGAE